MVTIPKEVVQHEGIREGEILEIEVAKPKSKKSYLGALKGIGPFTKEDRWDVHD
ncbi:AbrB/MazE/SpoVT family DNA-binding domain-containing protein [Candidatus Woesearchaeota archaeon]|nr:AbrB/MazE/SpoVT family DNA-binding domain-containing protein [Candidatus Woesearchaeota archaeon]